jgi:hypothetical protein
MASVSSNIAISQPVDKVFGFVTSAENQKSWQAGILDAKATPAGPIALGSIYHYTTEVMGRRVETQLQVSAFEQNKKWGVKTTGVPRPVETVYLFESDVSNTRLTISMELNGGYPAAAEAMVKQQMQKSLDDQSHRIKQMIEAKA